MFDSTQRQWHFYLDDMIGFGEKVIVYTDGLDHSEISAFRSDAVLDQNLHTTTLSFELNARVLSNIDTL